MKFLEAIEVGELDKNEECIGVGEKSWVEVSYRGKVWVRESGGKTFATLKPF